LFAVILLEALMGNDREREDARAARPGFGKTIDDDSVPTHERLRQDEQGAERSSDPVRDIVRRIMPRGVGVDPDSDMP
jgi:hypothetical protein